MATMLIGAVAAKLGVNPRTLRYYEQLRMLSPAARTVSGYRVYDEAAVQRLAFIAKAKSLGLTLKEIRQILAVRDSGRLPCALVQRLLQEHITRIDRQIAQLQALKTNLTTLLDGWRPEKQRNTVPCTICPRIEAGMGPRKSDTAQKGGEQ
jgi:DNA-binding transcriptional MerR regulator